jgi:hypothetical protein
MAFRGADLLHGAVAQREVNLSSGLAGGLDREAGPREETLSDAVVTSILFQTSGSSTRKPTLSAKTRDQPQLFERTEMSECRWRLDVKSGGDVLKARAAAVFLLGRDDPKCVYLSVGQSLERFHGVEERRTIYNRDPNY